MIFFLFLVAGLDLTLPEFQPETDLSGNYIVSDFDVSSGEITFEELEALPYGLTVAELDTSEDDPVFSEPIFNRDGSGTITQSDVFLTIDTTNYVLKSGGRSHYLELLPGYTYTITTDAPRIFLASELVANTPVTVAESNVITPSSTIYAVVGSSRTISATFFTSGSSGDTSGNDSSGNDSSGNDPVPENPTTDLSAVLIELQ